MGERKARHLQQNDYEAKYRRKPFNAFAKGEDFLLKATDIHIDNVDRDNLGPSRGHPAASGGARNTSPSCVSDVTRRPDQIAKSMIIPLLNASCGNHDTIITATIHRANSDIATPTHVQQGRVRILGRHPRGCQNSRTQVQNVVADSTACDQSTG